jgi:hypothetical protein
MMSANTELWGLGVSRDTIRRWQDLGLIASRETPAIADRANGCRVWGWHEPVRRFPCSR